MDITPRGDDPSPGADDRPRADGGRVPAQLFAALTASHAQLRYHGDTSALAIAWDRMPGERRIRVLVGGRPYFPPARHGENSDQIPILYPPGSLGRYTDAGELAADWARLSAWIRCAGGSDPLWTPQDGDGKPPARGGFDDYVAHLPTAFAWLVIAMPRDGDAVEKELLDLEMRMPRMRMRENSESDRIALLRAEGRYRELSRAQPSGIWTVHVLVGAAGEADARSAAALLCSATDLDALPYVLTPGNECASLAETWARTVDGEPLHSPFTATAELLAAVARPPRRELPGIHLIEQPVFDMTPEYLGEIPIGVVLDDADQPVGGFGVTLDTLNRHTFVAGATGSGKSQTVRHLLGGLYAAGVPWLVIEPAKAEYAGMAGRLGAGGQVHVIRPGDPEVAPAGLNPLEPAPGFPLQTHLDLTRALFLAAFEAEEPFPQVLAHALTRCYIDLGWDTVTGEAYTVGRQPRYPNLRDLQATAKEVVDRIGYGREVRDNIRGFVDVRIGSLRLGTPGRFFEGGHPIDVVDLLRRNMVLEIEDIGADEDKAFFIGAVLIRVFEHLRVHHDPSAPVGLRHVIVLEEAHRLLKRVEPGSPASHAVELFTSLLAEIRAYGEGIVVAEQIPEKIVPDVIKNTACKILHRLPAADDRAVVGATMNLSEAQSRHVVTLTPGRAAIFTDGMDRPLRLTVPLGESAEDSSTASKSPPVLGPRGVACGPICRARLCSLRELNRAVHEADDPRLVLWIELLTVAHLAARPAPRPDPGWVAELLTRFDRRVLDCAVAHRIEIALDSRYLGIAKHYQPETLAEHLAVSARATLDGIDPGCDGKENCWQAGQFRWVDVSRALCSGDGSEQGTHPDTTAWAERGLVLPGNTWAEQLAALERRPEVSRPDPITLRGSATPPLFQTAVDALARHADPRERFLAATVYLNMSTVWAISVLAIKQA